MAEVQGRIVGGRNEPPQSDSPCEFQRFDPPPLKNQAVLPGIAGHHGLMTKPSFLSSGTNNRPRLAVRATYRL
jgi:hypothetical protein